MNIELQYDKRRPYHLGRKRKCGPLVKFNGHRFYAGAAPSLVHALVRSAVVFAELAEAYRKIATPKFIHVFNGEDKPDCIVPTRIFEQMSGTRVR